MRMSLCKGCGDVLLKNVFCVKCLNIYKKVKKDIEKMENID